MAIFLFLSGIWVRVVLQRLYIIFVFIILQHGCPALPRHGVLHLVLFVAGV